MSAEVSRRELAEKSAWIAGLKSALLAGLAQKGHVLCLK
jgi:hypothetical protein